MGEYEDRNTAYLQRHGVRLFIDEILQASTWEVRCVFVYKSPQAVFILRQSKSTPYLNLLKPTGYVMHQQFSIQQLYVLPTLYLCVLYLSENKQRLVPLTA